MQSFQVPLNLCHIREHAAYETHQVAASQMLAEEKENKECQYRKLDKQRKEIVAVADAAHVRLRTGRNRDSSFAFHLFGMNVTVNP